MQDRDTRTLLHTQRFGEGNPNLWPVGSFHVVLILGQRDRRIRLTGRAGALSKIWSRAG